MSSWCKKQMLRYLLLDHIGLGYCRFLLLTFSHLPESFHYVNPHIKEIKRTEELCFISKFVEESTMHHDFESSKASCVRTWLSVQYY